MNRSAWIVVGVISLVAMSGSLYFSEVKGFIPCDLCWYQRILMYPLVLFSVIGYWKDWKEGRAFIVGMSILGLTIAAYHWVLQLSQNESLAICTGDGGCVVKYVDWFGFITIPFMSYIAFVLILFSLVVTTKRKR